MKLEPMREKERSQKVTLFAQVQLDIPYSERPIFGWSDTAFSYSAYVIQIEVDL
jgi:hypothetical protein